jgi:hypothetical protein
MGPIMTDHFGQLHAAPSANFLEGPFTVEAYSRVELTLMQITVMFTLVGAKETSRLH